MKAGKILLVEDSSDDQLLIQRAFRKHNIVNDIDIAMDGVEALDYLFSADVPQPLPQLILLDVKLPRVDGLEVLRKVRANNRTRLVPVVMLTSSDEERDIVESYELGANSYVRKPVDFHQFANAVSQLGLYWLILNEPPEELE
ncbi:response regulator [Phototrophicus methaneseepsis]|uniref:Response regulator n=1 Tax=Phototrophicus methaneseepsis TaxID=2710758 RepID=A0A7S8IGF1_9CHLR|nr:response regulator [Phototrophicus methaneseepsis]QPC83953.1 response regulator [Phototrophicus methaneseepsis]